MAQAGSFTRTIKVQQLESALQTAVASLPISTSSTSYDAKAKSVKKLAARLLAARQQVLRSRIADMQPKGISDRGLRTKLARMEVGGVGAILSEFGANGELSVAPRFRSRVN
jgi:hypothetical protein